MWLDAIALAVLGFFAGMGALRGGLAAGLGLASLGAAYAAALVAAPRLGPGVARQLDVPELLGLPIAGTLAFFGVYAAAGLVSAVARRREERRLEGPRSARDRFLGATFGAVRGGLVVLLLAWLALWVDALRATGTLASLPELGASRAASVAGSVVEAGVSAALSGAGAAGPVMARVAARPNRSLVGLQSLVESPPVQAVRDDAAFWTYVESGSIEAALNRGSFWKLSHDAALRGQLAELGLIETAAAADPEAFRDASREMLSELGPRLRRLRRDPELARLMEDPEVVAMVQSNDTLGLMTHPGFRRLVASVATTPAN